MSGKWPKFQKNPELDACCLSKFSLFFVIPTLLRGYRKRLEVDDLCEPLPEHISEAVTKRMTEAWEMENQQAAKANREPSMIRVIQRLYGKRFILFGINVLIENIFHLLQPIALGLLLRYFRHNAPLTKNEAYLAAIGVAVCSIMISFCHHPYFYQMLKFGLELKVGSCGMIMEKAVRLSCGSLQKITVGHIINLLSTDVAKFEETFLFLHYLWLSPLIIIVSTYLLWNVIGLSSLAGYLVLIVLVFVQSYVGRQMGRCRREIAIRMDKRVNATSEILNGFRQIKMYAWEDAFSDLINSLRREELSKVRGLSIRQSFTIATFWISLKLIMLFAVVCYLFTGHQISAERIFVTAALYNSSLLPLALFFPHAIRCIFDTRVSLSRIQAFLKLEEHQEVDYFTTFDQFFMNSLEMDQENLEKVPLMRVEAKEMPTALNVGNTMVEMINYSSSWDIDGDVGTEILPVIRNITLSVNKGQLVVVAGPVGCGKSSLLLSILRETKRINGILRTNGRIAYAPQEPWIFPGSIRDNILFGCPFIKSQYEEVVEFCCLKWDFSQLPYGDRTSVGDRGQSLSGGQKARISLARAVYQNADIYLLDDPLSAVDSVVGQFLFDRCIKHYLRSKATILVTHQVQHLSNADLIVLMHDGEITAFGSTESLEQMQTFNEIIQETERSYSMRRTESREVADVPLIKPSVAEELNDDSTINDLSDSTIRNSNKPINNVAYSSEKTESECSDPISEENRPEGAVSWRIYFLYIKAMAHPRILAFLMVIFAAIIQGFSNVTDWWLSKWANAAEMAGKQWEYEVEMNLDHVEYVDQIQLGPIRMSKTLAEYKYVYIAMVCIVVVTSFLRSAWFRLSQLVASRILHNLMFQRVAGATVSFYDKNPTGQILNRFSKDISTLDNQLSFDFFDFFMGLLSFGGSLIIIIVINPIAIALVTPLIVLLIFIRRFYLSTSRDLKRLEATTRSPVYSHITSILYGLICVRASSNQQYVIDTYHKYQNINTAAFYLIYCTARWLTAVVDWIVIIFTIALTFFSIASPISLTASEVGLILVYSIQLLNYFPWIVLQSAKLQTDMVSMERIINYTELPQEPYNEGAIPPSNWPSKGHLHFQNVSFYYDEGLPAALKNVSAEIFPKEKIGIVGRTGSGKSSLLKALFRLSEPDGNIIIDDYDTKLVALKVLRKRIAIIPQDPVLFIGTVAKNLDPFGEYSSEEIWKVLEQVELKNVVSELPLGLETNIQEGGANFSVGQRQLICLARALLRQSRILVIDEATANVDPLTDDLIQRKIKECFHESTVLTIAHRLHTVMNSDRVMVFENGELIEFDHPHTLLCQPNSTFTILAAQTSRKNMKYLMVGMNNSTCENKEKESNQS